MTHTVNGITYERLPEGSIRVLVLPGSLAPSVMTQEQWVDLVASMSRTGLSSITAQWAKDLHETDLGEFDANT